MDIFASDLHAALRRLLRRPVFVLLGVTALGLGLASAVLVFMAVNTLALRPPPGLQTPDRLVELGRLSGGGGFDSFSHPDFEDVRDRTTSLDKVFAYRVAPAYASTHGAPQRALALVVSGQYFEALGAGAAHGRLLTPADDNAPGRDAVAVVSHAAFERIYGADPRAVGTAVQINGGTYTLVGVAAPRFRGHIAPLSPDFYVPLSMAEAMHVVSAGDRDQRGARSLLLGGRLAEGATLEQANAELQALTAHLASAYPQSNANTRFAAAALRPLPQLAQRVVGALAAALFVLCLAILALACTNLAGVLLAQGEARAGELSMRSALGASRARIARELFLEAALVAIGGGALALVLVAFGRGLLNLLPLPAPFPIDLSLHMDWRVVAFCFGTTALVAIGFGLLPALRVSAEAPARGAALAGGSLPQRRQRLRHGLLAVQAAMTVALLLTAALVVRALDTADAIDTGFRIDGVYTANVDMTPTGAQTPDAVERLHQLSERLVAQPGIAAASFASVTPLTMSRLGFGDARLPGTQETLSLDVNTVGEGFFDVVELPLRGRALERSDSDGAERTAVVNQTLARRLFGERSAVGGSFELGYGDDWQSLRIVGVVPDGRYASLGDAGTAFAFLPAAQWQRAEFTLMLRAAPGGPGAEALRRTIEREMAVLLPDVPPPQVHAFADVAALSTLPQAILGTAASALGTLALLLAAAGLYGVLALQLERRLREFGVRKALGAPPLRIVAALLRRTLPWLAGGALVGLLLGQLAAVALGDLLFGIGGADPAAAAAVGVLFFAMVLLATAAPLRRALRLQPSHALRYD